MKKLFFLTSLLCASLTHTAPVTINFELTITGHEPIKKQLTFDNGKETTWRIDTGKIIIVGTVPNSKMDTALITFKIFLQQANKEYKLISSPSINAAWGKKSEVRIVEKETGKDEWKLSLDVVVTKQLNVETRE